MLSDELRKLRKERNLTQNQLAEALNISQSTVASWEKGTRQPTTDFLPTIAEFYGISIDSLLGMIDESEQNQPKIPVTAEAKILAAGIDKMPEADRKRAIEIMTMVFNQYKDFFEKGEYDATGL